MATKVSNKVDPYSPQLEALKSGMWKAASLATDRAAFLNDKIDRWDAAKFGDWEDAVAVASRRQRLFSRDPLVLLARLIWGLDAKRGAEVGRLAAKFIDRDPSSVATAIYASGGVKAASKSTFKPHPPKRPRVRKTTSVDAKPSRRAPKTRS